MNPQTFLTNIQPLKNKLFRFASRMLGSVEEAEDVVQEVFIKLWKNKDYLDQINNLDAWCMTATRNLSIDKLRSKHQKVQPLHPGMDREDKAPTPYHTTANNDMVEHVRRFMEQLPEKQRQIMHLRDIEEYTYQEIADALDISLEQVKVYLFRARKAVREQLLRQDAEAFTDRRH
ncbi:MAG: RNA polymerase sigma factor [Saprospiraceae bacterium]|jgi:RNA polymerase sigma-70 factor (ECF subfamily)